MDDVQLLTSGADVASDEFLMRRFQAGDGEAFREIFHRYANRLVNFVYRSLLSREEAEDLAQEVLVRLYKGKDRYNTGRPFRPWVFSITARLVSNRIRDRKRRPHDSLDFSLDKEEPLAGALDFPDLSALGADEAVEKKRLAGIVQVALKNLPESQRFAAVLAWFEEMSYQEIAAALNTSVASVRSLLFRARHKLKSYLEPFGFDDFS